MFIAQITNDMSMETKTYGPGTKEAVEQKLTEKGFRRNNLNQCFVTTDSITKRDVYENYWSQDGECGSVANIIELTPLESLS